VTLPRVSFVAPPQFAPPKGYAYGAVTTGPLLHVGGQVGWDPATGRFASDDFVQQLAQCLDNVLAVVAAAGAGPADIARMTVYVTDLDAYRTRLREIGAVWKARLGRHYPAMALVGVAGLVEREALVEIEAVAALPPPPAESTP